MDAFTVYGIHDGAGPLVYVGSTCNFRSRARDHQRAKGKNKPLRRWIGERAGVRIDVLHVAASKDEMLQVEHEYILSFLPAFNRSISLSAIRKAV